MAALSLVRDDVNLDSLAEQANDFHARSEEAGRARIEYALAAGQALVEAKRLVAHGGWLPWLEEHFAGSQQNASNYMRLAANYQRVSNLLADDPDLSIREALKAIAKPKDKPTTGTCAECGDDFPPEELTDTEDGNGKLCDNCLDDEPAEPVPPTTRRAFTHIVRQIHPLLDQLSGVDYSAYDEHDQMMATDEIDDIIYHLNLIKGAINGNHES